MTLDSNIFLSYFHLLIHSTSEGKILRRNEGSTGEDMKKQLQHLYDYSQNILRKTSVLENCYKIN